MRDRCFCIISLIRNKGKTGKKILSIKFWNLQIRSVYDIISNGNITNKKH